jgi:mono/diheme cytochrome c family protein
MAMVWKTGLAVLMLFSGASSAPAQPGDAAAGEDAYVANCVQCHASVARIVRKIDGDSAEDKSAWLDTFLAEHHLRDMDAKADLIAYLISL